MNSLYDRRKQATMIALSRKQILAIVLFLLFLLCIPAGMSLVKQSQILRSKAEEGKTSQTSQTIGSQPVTQPKITPTSSTLTELQKLVESGKGIKTDDSGAQLPQLPTNTLTPIPSSSEVGLAFGPTLNISLTLEGRPAGKQGGKVFVGISSGTATTNPSYLLTFTLDFPDSGVFKGVSLAGLNPGSTYTAYVKGPAQIDKASTFVMGATETNLNNNQPLFLLTGDLNEDNTINSADFMIAKALYGTTPASRNWNPLTDFNLDGIINNYDLSYIQKNFGKTGDSSIWYSPVSTSSGLPSGKANISSGGYWLFVP